jgi:hypothetical protein
MGKATRLYTKEIRGGRGGQVVTLSITQGRADRAVRLARRAEKFPVPVVTTVPAGPAITCRITLLKGNRESICDVQLYSLFRLRRGRNHLRLFLESSIR